MTNSAERKQISVAITWVSLLTIWVTVNLLSSCTSAKKLVYFQGLTSNEDTLSVPAAYIPLIKQGDLLQVQVSSLNSDASAYFNPPALTDANNTSGVANPLTRTSGYLVANDGSIKLPLVGILAVSGLTNAQASELVSSKLKIYLKEPTVNVRKLNFSISVLGEVTRPSLYTIPNEQVTIPEALGLAGDMTIYGRRDNVLIIREEGNRRVFARLDLTKRETFRSPYYSLHSNDIVYVEPGKTRITSVDRTYQLAPIVIGILSIVAIVVTRI